MRSSEIEAWVLRVVDQIRAGDLYEDSRVELKSEWPESPEKFARRLAGHANAARGESVLWIIGVDQKAGRVVGAEKKDLADWYPEVKSMFDAVAPEVQDLVVPIDTESVVALHFHTLRPPFLVKNPAHGKREGGPVVWEVPWRENTSTRTAQRSDLIQILQPLQRRPEVELLGGEARHYRAYWTK